MDWREHIESNPEVLVGKLLFRRLALLVLSVAGTTSLAACGSTTTPAPSAVASRAARTYHVDIGPN